MNEMLDELIYKSDSESFQTKLEDLTTDKNELKMLLDFIEVPFRESYWDALQKPDHVYVPINYSLTDLQREQFNEIAGAAMEKFGYDINEDEYNVKY